MAEFRNAIRLRLGEIERTLQSVENMKIERERLAELLQYYDSIGNNAVLDSVQSFTTALSEIVHRRTNGNGETRTRGKALDPNSATSLFVKSARETLERLGRTSAQFYEIYEAMPEADRSLFSGEFKEQSARKALARASDRAGLVVEPGGLVRIAD